MSRKVFILFTVVVAALFLFSGVSIAQTWKPEKPINLIVPWGAGGSTDQVTRIVAGELEDALGQKIVAVNQPGASGSVGTKTVMDAKKDGYYWASGAAGDLGTYIVKGFLETKIEDWHLYLDVANVMVVSVNPETPYKDFGELLKAFKDNPGKITVATAGEVSMGAVAIEAIKKNSGIQYKHVSYDGGNPAVIATVSGECQVTPQLAVEQVDMIRAKKLRPLAALTDEDLNRQGLRDYPVDQEMDPEHEGPSFLFRRLRAEGSPQRGCPDTGQSLGKVHCELGQAERICRRSGGGLYSLLWERCPGEGLPLHPICGVALLGCRKGQDEAGHRRDSSPVSDFIL